MGNASPTQAQPRPAPNARHLLLPLPLALLGDAPLAAALLTGTYPGVQKVAGRLRLGYAVGSMEPDLEYANCFKATPTPNSRPMGVGISRATLSPANAKE